VFCIDNIDPTCEVAEMRDYVKELGVRVISCFSVKSRRRRSDVEGEPINRQAFRLCIPSEDCSLLLDAEHWPEHIFISEWFFKPADQVAPVKIGAYIDNKLSKLRLAAAQNDVTIIANSAQLSSRGSRESSTELIKGLPQSIGDDVIRNEDHSAIHIQSHTSSVEVQLEVEVHQPTRSSAVTEVDFPIDQPANSDVDNDVDDVMDEDITILTQEVTVTQVDGTKLNDGGKK
jgi:hypothetical protein